MPTERYEILILGSGFGGKLLAWDMAGAGHRTAVVERSQSAYKLRVPYRVNRRYRVY